MHAFKTCLIIFAAVYFVSLFLRAILCSMMCTNDLSFLLPSIYIYGLGQIAYLCMFPLSMTNRKMSPPTLI